MILRVPDDVHARLVERARAAGRSINSVATEILDKAVADEQGDRRAALRARARRAGVLAGRPHAAIPDEVRERAIASTRGVGPSLDRLLTDGR